MLLGDWYMMAAGSLDEIIWEELIEPTPSPPARSPKHNTPSHPKSHSRFTVWLAATLVWFELHGAICAAIWSSILFHFLCFQIGLYIAIYVSFKRRFTCVFRDEIHFLYTRWVRAHFPYTLARNFVVPNEHYQPGPFDTAYALYTSQKRGITASFNCTGQ